MNAIRWTAVAAVVAAVCGAAPAEAAPESANVQIQMRKLADKLARAYAEKLGDAWRYQRVGVVKFQEHGAAADQSLGSVVASELSTLLVRDHGFNLVERGQLAKVLEEQGLWQSGVVPEDKAAEVGKLLDAQALVVGEVSEAGDQFLINARIISTENGTTVVADNISLGREGLIALSSNALVLRTKGGAAFRSVAIPGWGQYYNRDLFGAAAFGGAALVAAGFALGFQFDGMANRSRYDDVDTNTYVGNAASKVKARSCGGNPPDPSCTAEYYRNEAESDYRARNIAVGALVGVWVLNIAHAYFTGVDGETEGGTGGGAWGLAPTTAPASGPTFAFGPTGDGAGALLRLDF